MRTSRLDRFAFVLGLPAEVSQQAEVHKVDRLARNRYDDATITYALQEAGAELVSVTENIDRTPVGAFMHAIVAANAEFYSANLAAEAKKGLVQKAKSGGTPHRAPLGYLNVRKLIEGQEIRTVEIDPERAALPLSRSTTPPSSKRRPYWRRTARRYREGPKAPPLPEGLALLPVPIDQLRQEQDRLTTESNQAERQLEIAEASVADVEDVLGKALDLLTDCQRAYLAAPGHLRRQWNQALFERLVVYDDKIGEAEVTEPFATLADRRLPELLGGKAPAQGAVSSDGGWNKTALVGETGFEPV